MSNSSSSSLSVSRVLWEVVYTSDGCLRQGIATQLEQLLEVMNRLQDKLTDQGVPPDLRTVYRSLQFAMRMHETAKEVGKGA